MSNDGTMLGNYVLLPPGPFVLCFMLYHCNLFFWPTITSNNLKNGHIVLFEIRTVNLYYKLGFGVLLVESFKMFSVP